MPNPAKNKGSGGEREICDMLNPLVNSMREVDGLTVLNVQDYPFQRNQNQTAVGGSDITNPYQLDIEVKRQEALSVNTWWKQTVEAANRSGGIPILIFRQNRKKWRVIMMGGIPVRNGNGWHCNARVEISIEDFRIWFCTHYRTFTHTQEGGVACL